MNMIEQAYRKFCEERFPLPSEAQLRALEQRINIAFPDDYRRFVSQYNGGYFNEPEIEPVAEGCPRDALDSMYGIGASHPTSELGRAASLALFGENVPPKIVPIGDTVMGGLIILDTAPGEGRGSICLKQAFGDFYYLADSIEQFFSLLREPTQTG